MAIIIETAAQGVNWAVAELFPEAMEAADYKRIQRKRFAVSKLNGETVAYYEYVFRGNYHQEITAYLYAIRGGKPFLLERYDTRRKDY